MHKLLGAASLAAASMAAFAPSGAAAFTGLQLEAGGSYIPDTETGAVTGRASFNLGVAPFIYVGPEAEVNFGVAGSEDIGFGQFETDRLFGGFGKIGAKIGPFDVHGRFGFQSARFRVDLPGPTETTDTDGAFAFGFGGTFWFNEDWGVRGEFTRSDGLGQIGVTAAYRF